MANYTTGTITLTNGSKVVNGTGTAWQTALIVGGIIYPEASGNAMPFSAVTNDTQITADVAWKGASGTYSYSLAPDTAYDRQVLANSSALATILQQLKATAIAAISALTPAADRLAYFTGAGTAALTTLTSFARSLLDDADAATARATLKAARTDGQNTFSGTQVVSISPAATAADYYQWSPTDFGTGKPMLAVSKDAAAASWTLGLWDGVNNAGTLRLRADAISLLGNVTLSADKAVSFSGTGASTTLTNLGVSAFAKTILDDASGSAMFATMGSNTSGSQIGYIVFPNGMKVMWGTSVITTTSAGDSSITFPTAFAAGRQVVAINGDHANGGSLTIAENISAGQPLSGFNLRVFNGTAIVPNATVRISWHALGV